MIYLSMSNYKMLDLHNLNICLIIKSFFYENNNRKIYDVKIIQNSLFIVIYFVSLAVCDDLFRSAPILCIHTAYTFSV